MNKQLFYTPDQYKLALWKGAALGMVITFIVLAFIGLWLP